MEHDHTAVIRVLQSGESMPPDDGDWLSVGTSAADDDVLAVMIRYSDTRGVRYAMSTPPGPRERMHPPKPLKPWWRRRRDEADW